MSALMMMRPVDGNECFGPQYLNHGALLFAAPMATGVNLRMCISGDDFQSTSLEPVDHIQHAELIAGDDARREDHGVAGLDLQARVFVAGQSGEARRALALGAAGEDQDLIAG